MNFPTTNWTALALATRSGDAEGRRSLEEMCRAYRPPVEGFLRSRGFSSEDAEDLTQQFFLGLIQSRAWQRAERARGRFRTFMLGALMHVVAHAAHRDRAEKRGGTAILASLDQLGDKGFEPAAPAPEFAETFDREWAWHLVARAVTDLEGEWSGGGKGEDFRVLRVFLPGAGTPPSYDHAAAALAQPIGTVKTAIHRLRTRFRERLFALVAGTVSAPHEVAGEIQHLRDILVRGPQ